jgi:hypothetical protein
MKTLWRVLTSLKTCVWLGLAFTAAGAAGSVLLGRHPELFADMDAFVFAGWFARKGFAAPGPTLWLYGLLLTTTLLAVNAFCCTALRLVQLFRGRLTLRRLMPHVMHLGFLGVVLAHLVSATGGDRVPGVAVPEGMFAPVGDTGLVLRLDRLHVEMAPQGYPKDFAAHVTLFRDVAPVTQGAVRANAPLFHDGYGIHLKDFGPTPWGAPYAVFDANRDPGAPWVLAAALLFTAANAVYLIPSRRENA